MEVNELISKYGLRLRADGNIGVSYNEKEAKIEAEKREREQEIADILSGEKLIKVSWNDGEYLMGWEVFGEAGQLLEKIGLAKYVSGWGYNVSDEVIKDLGEEFSYPTAEEYIRPANEKKEAEEKEQTEKEKARIEDLQRIAKETGKNQLIESFPVNCPDPDEECNTDIVSRYMTPDGTIETVQSHTW